MTPMPGQSGRAGRQEMPVQSGQVDVLIIAGNSRSLIANRGDLIREMIDKGLRVAAVVPRADYLTETDQLGIDVHLIEMARTATNPMADARYFIQLWRLIRRLKPTDVFSYTAKPVIYGSLAAKFAGVPGRYAMITGLGHAYTTNSRKTRAVRTVMNRLYRSGIASCSKVFFQNPDDVEEFAAVRILRDRSKVVRVNGSGVDTLRFPQRPIPAERERLGPASEEQHPTDALERPEDFGPENVRSSKGPMFLFVGRLLTEKGIAEFVAAAAKVKEQWPDARFTAVGPHDPALPHSISTGQLEKWRTDGVVEFIGGVKDIKPWLERCTVFTLPSYREGTPRSVLEAMSTGRPIITTDAPGCRETVVDGVNGILVPPRSVEPLATAMAQLLASRELIIRMADASRAIAEDKYEVRKVNRVILEAMGL